MLNNFSDRLSSLRGNRSKAEFARLLGVSPPLYHQWEDGQTPRYEKVSLIAEKCGVSVEWLMTGKEPEGAGRAALFEKPNIMKCLEDAYNQMMKHPDGKKLVGWVATAMAEATTAITLYDQGQTVDAKSHAYEAQRIFGRIFTRTFE